VKRLLREWFRHRQHTLEGRDVLVRVTQALHAPERALDEVQRLIPETP
jgi:ribonuclease P protein component